jgi:hypothetical protein
MLRYLIEMEIVRKTRVARLVMTECLIDQWRTWLVPR